MRVMYLDESGDHNLRRINPIFPVFVLGGVIVDRAYSREVVLPAIQAFKRRHFEHDDVVLHTVEMAKGRGKFGFLADPGRRAAFYLELNELVNALEFQVIACVIRKDKHLERYGAHAVDPYHYSLEILVERFCRELGEDYDSGFICAEKRNPGLDKELLAAWEELLRNDVGTGFVSSRAIDERILGLDLKDKTSRVVALELADLVVTPIGRFFAGMPIKPNEVQWPMVERKLRRVDGRYEGFGLVVRPA
jgi:hypothetical protein